MNKHDLCHQTRLINTIVSLIAATTVAVASPLIRVTRDTGTGAGAALRLGLPSNATSIRSGEISERFSCLGRHYGYYADPDNDCQLFHVCLPVQFDDGRNSMYKWSFVCPEDTIFNQETFTCSRKEDAIACEESERFYGLNEDLGRQKPVSQEPEASNDVEQEHPVADAHVVIMDRPVRPLDQHQDVMAPTTESADEGTIRYAAFTTIRY